MAQLLAGEMPQDIEEAFADVNLSLFPTSRELAQECSCPDWADVCKHLASVHYILAERFDEDPFLLFRLRGRTQDAIMAALGKLQGAGDSEESAVPKYEPPRPLSDSLTNFCTHPTQPAQSAKTDTRRPSVSQTLPKSRRQNNSCAIVKAESLS